MKKKSLGLNAFFNGMRSVLSLIFPLITFPYISRVLSVSGIGIYNFSNTYVSYFILIAGLGIATYAVREGAKYRNQKEKIEEFTSQVFSINMIATIIAYLLLFLSLVIFKSLSNYVTCILIYSLQILFTTLGTEWIYTIYEDYAYITIRSIAFKILSIILLFILVRKPSDYLWYATIAVLAAVGSNILNFIHARSFINIRLTLNIKWRYHLKPIMIIFASAVAVTIFTASDTTILGILKNDYAVGIYSTSVKIYQITEGLLSAILTVTIPRLAMLWGQKRRREYDDVLTQVINTLGILVLPASIGLIMLSQEVVLIIAGHKFLPSVNSLRIITWAIIFSIFSWIFSDCVLIPVKRESEVLRNTLVTATINVILNFILIPSMSYDGTSLSTVIAEFSVMVMNGYSCRDIIKPIIFKKETLKNLFESIIGCIGIVIVCLLCQWGLHSMIWKTIFSMVLSVPMYGAILILLGNEIAISMLNNVLNIVKSKL
ncbi:flippase [Lactobacillus helveticus]|uniref:flippase n=1 Tax=Lactobacillus helveticus TaxID=1587 RepID=UPI00081A8889|nr:flippase [Lactobacillus helveticus]ANZ56483.1 poly-gamma-glutamate biosynthesis protein [Lactobacillus helveticus]AQY52926.1 poly-gamma-glutamate biosynthesis protein [Lactobacillus helveticus]MBU6035245.1 flippase [Lactobacillus helveticus]MBW1220381.1 flippase [Lactobacillus helveticus]MDY0876257.1 flippase [Lactobacillus helveticus]